MKKIIPLCIMLTLVSCKKESETTPDTVNDTITQTTVNEPVAIKIDSLPIYVAQINNNRQKALTALKTASAQEADKIYDRLVADNGAVLGKIYNLESKLLEEFYTHFSQDEKQVPDAIITGKTKILKNGGLEFWAIGEGFAEIRTEADYYKNIFADKVTKEYRDYIALLAEDDKELWQADAAINIPWSDLGTRVINWENFLKNYPDSNHRKDAEDTYKIYRHTFLLGLDNTQVIEITNNQMDAEARKAFTAFVKDHPDSETTAYVKMLLEDVNNKDKVAEVVRTDF